ncbi:hypothetical protein DSO57_1021494 [Entomophthora muscae]|uniref:Uncharacterized protein n=1 Tax=Entomophthora muscae TaxID=34485 RepID=A0ACC2RI43_9FUNG|nr:hypothetical protein DSO57_1021494 [Entomophthora muscae]
MDHQYFLRRALAPPKRACDQCRKCRVKCDLVGGKCLRCSQEGLPCTYLDPTRKRGPKPRHPPSSPTRSSPVLGQDLHRPDLMLKFLTRMNSSGELLEPHCVQKLLDPLTPAKRFLIFAIHATATVCLSQAPLSDTAIESYSKAVESMPLDPSHHDQDYAAGLRILGYLQHFCNEIMQTCDPKHLL